MDFKLQSSIHDSLSHRVQYLLEGDSVATEHGQSRGKFMMMNDPAGAVSILSYIEAGEIILLLPLKRHHISHQLYWTIGSRCEWHLSTKRTFHVVTAPESIYYGEGP